MERKDYRLAAILYTDIAGFSKMMEKNETQTLDLLHRHNELIEKIVAGRGGTVIKTIGDAFLIDFKNTVDALQSAIDIQNELYAYNKDHADFPVLVRIGAHLGDIYFYENDALGEGINIAARLQSIARPGCICMSQDVYNLVINKVDFQAEKLGPVSLKNISKEIQVYEIASANVEFDGSKRAVPDGPARTSTASVMKGESTPDSNSGAKNGAPADDDAMARAADIKRRIMLDIKAAGRRLSVDQMLVRYEREGAIARSVIEELANNGILLREAAQRSAMGSDDNRLTETDDARFGGGRGTMDGVIHAVSQLEYRLEDEIKRGLSEVLTARREGRKEESRERRRELVRDMRRAYKDHRRAYRRGEPLQTEDKRPAADAWDSKLEKSYFRTEVDSVSDFDAYTRKVRKEAWGAKAGFVGHLIPFVAVNGALMWINMTFSPGFPWALFPFGGWGIGLIQHFASTLRRGDRAKELARMPPLNKEQLGLFKKLQKAKDSMLLHATSTVTTTTFLAMVNGLVSPNVPWFLIAGAGMGIGLLSHLARYFSQKAELQGAILDSLGLSGRWKKALSGKAVATKSDDVELGPYKELVEDARTTRAAIVSQVTSPKEKKGKRGQKRNEAPVGDDLVPALDSYVEQVALLAKRTNEVDRIIELIPMDSLYTDKENLRQKIAGNPGEGLRKEYEKSLREIERQETSFNDLKDQREVLELRMRSSVNTLKQMRIDLARLAGMADQDDTASALAVRDKTAELNRYLADLRAGYDELDKLEARFPLSNGTT